MAWNLECQFTTICAGDHFASSALFSLLVELDDLEDDLFLAGSLVGLSFSFQYSCVASLLVLTCPRIWTEPGSNREGSGLEMFLLSFLAL